MARCFTADDISEFCRVTEDNNLIHNPEYMHSQGKRAIVPGMLSFAAAAFGAGDFINSANYIRVLFSGPLFENEHFERIITHIMKPKEVRFDIVQKDSSIFSKTPDLTPDSSDSWYSCMKKKRKAGHFKKAYHDAFSVEGIGSACTASYDINRQSLESFITPLQKYGRISKESDTPVNAEPACCLFPSVDSRRAPILLYTIAFSSKVILDNFSSLIPYTQEQKQKEKQKRTLPVYGSLELYLTQMSFADLDALHFTAWPEQNGKRNKRNYSVRIICSGWQGRYRRKIYAGTYTLNLIPEQVLMKTLTRNL
jgi:hypothetical protein